MGEGAQQGRLAGAGRSVQEHESTRESRRVAREKPLEGRGHRAGVVGADVRPGRRLDVALGALRTVRQVPEAHDDAAIVGRGIIDRVAARGLDDIAPDLLGCCGHGEIGVAVLPADDVERPARAGGHEAGRAPLLGQQERLYTRREQAGVGADPVEAHLAGPRLLTRGERGQAAAPGEAAGRVPVANRGDHAERFGGVHEKVCHEVGMPPSWSRGTVPARELGAAARGADTFPSCESG